MASLLTVLPELFLLLAGCGVLIADACYGDKRSGIAYTLAQATLVVTLVLILVTGAAPRTAFYDHMIVDAMAAIVKFIVVAIAALVYLYSRTRLREGEHNCREYYVLGLYAVLGAMVLISANSLLVVYLGLELLSLPLYAMVAIHRNNPHAAEAAMKYFVLGALASGLLLYGFSMLYGATGGIHLQHIRTAAAGTDGNTLYILGLVFSIAGIAFKFGAFPFHAWVPDVYDGAPLPVTLFIASVSKLAAFAMAVRLLYDALPGQAGPMLIVLAAGSMLLGNVAALTQTRTQRLLAYSAIAHVGFLLLGVIAGGATGFAGAMFYAIVYAVSTLGAFGLCTLLNATQLEDFSGLSRQRPWLALLLLILMFSMAGVPPFAGFWAKWFVIREVLQAGHVWLAVLAVISSIIGAYYYLRLVKLAYFDETPSAVPSLAASRLAVLSVNVLALLAIGILPGTLMSLCLDAMA